MVFLWWCGGVFAFLWCFCGGVFCGGVVVFLWRCFCGKHRAHTCCSHIECSHIGCSHIECSHIECSHRVHGHTYIAFGFYTVWGLLPG